MLKSLLRFLFILLPAFCLLYALSQRKGVDLFHQLVAESKDADSLYSAATVIGNSKNYDEAKEAQLNRKALEIYNDVFRKAPAERRFDSMRFYSAFRIGELEHYFENFSKALKGYRYAISVQLNSQLADSLLFKPYLYSGILCYNQNEFDSAFRFFKKAEEIQTAYNYRLQERERLFNTFGVLYFQKGDYKQAKNYFAKALEVLPKTHPFYKELFANYKINLAQIYFKLEDYDEANRIYQSLLNLQGIDKNDINQNLGMINLYLGAPAKALTYFRKIKYGNSYKLIFLYHNIGEAFLNLNRADSAKKYFDRAVETSLSLGANTDHIAYGQTLKSLGDLHLQLRDEKKALRYYQSAIHQFYPAYSDTSVYSNPQSFSGVFSYINLFYALSAKAMAFHSLYERFTSMQNAQQELNAYQSAFKLIDYVERTYNSDEARLFLDKTKYAVHGKPIDIAYELYSKTNDEKYLDALYRFDQQNKASVLSLKMQSSEIMDKKETSMIFKERNIRSEITRLSLKANQVKDSAGLSAINKEIRDHEIELGKIQEQMPISAATVDIPSISFLRESFLDTKTALISFHLSDHELVTICITENKAGCLRQTLPDSFHVTVLNYVQNLKQGIFDSSDNKTSRQLYSILFGKLDIQRNSRLIIIPDDELNFLSFESLKISDEQYLVQKYSVQYQYSTALLKKDKSDFSGHNTLAFAPFIQKSFSDSTFHFESLPNSYTEIRNLKGEKFTGGSATKKNFLDKVPKFKVLHLATHAVVNTKNNERSFVAFYPFTSNQSDYLLYSEEISNLPLQGTSLVILSACETGAGNLVKGEGVMSLSRAFAYAGCPNVITSLWNANDFSTAYLTNKLHAYLDKRYSVDEALRQAKVDYLNDRSINPRLKNPFYWSHLVFVGNYIPAGTANYWWVVFAVAAIFLILLAKKIRPHKKEA